MVRMVDNPGAKLQKAHGKLAQHILEAAELLVAFHAKDLFRILRAQYVPRPGAEAQTLAHGNQLTAAVVHAADHIIVNRLQNPQNCCPPITKKTKSYKTAYLLRTLVELGFACFTSNNPLLSFIYSYSLQKILQFVNKFCLPAGIFGTSHSIPCIFLCNMLSIYPQLFPISRK